MSQIVQRIFFGVFSFFLTISSLFAQPNTLTPQEKEEDFELLFDGKSLSPAIWQSGIDVYSVENGAFTVRQGKRGNLMTKKQYENFILRFEFRYPPSGNNGVGIRANDATKDAAYHGMEIQILDPASETAPTNWHGSIYKLVASKPNKHFHKPYGQWNFQEIVADGSKIKVVLNDEIILDTDISGIDNSNHPGLHNKRGFVGFLAHQDPVGFRNVRIKEIQPDKTKEAATTVSPPKTGMRLWSGSNGRVIEAALLDFDGEVCKIKLKSGKEMFVLLELFSEEDRRFIQKQNVEDKLGPEMMKRSDFTDGNSPEKKNWDYWKGKTSGEASVVDGFLRIQTGKRNGEPDWIPVLLFSDFTLEKGKKYSVTCEMRCDQSATTHIEIKQTHGKNINLGFSEIPRLEPEWRTWTWTFTSNGTETKPVWFGFSKFQEDRIYDLRRISVRPIE